MSVAKPGADGRAQVVYLPGFRFDRASGRLWRGSEEVALRPKAAAVLSALVARSGAVVSKRDLMREVWPDGFVGDAALAVCVTELRRAFGDEARCPRYVANVPRRGYRLVAEVSLAPPQAAAPPRPFVGRRRELAVLRGWWDGALSGSRRAGFVAAQAGVGKTALADAFAAGVHDGLVGRGECVGQFGPGEPYLPVLDALAGLCGGPGGGLVRDALDRYAPSWLLALPGLLDPA